MCQSAYRMEGDVRVQNILFIIIVLLELACIVLSNVWCVTLVSSFKTLTIGSFKRIVAVHVLAER